MILIKKQAFFAKVYVYRTSFLSCSNNGNASWATGYAIESSDRYIVLGELSQAGELHLCSRPSVHS